MADYPKWFLGIVGHFKYSKKYEEKLKRAAAHPRSENTRETLYRPL